jgi:hypothetical protein
VRHRWSTATQTALAERDRGGVCMARLLLRGRGVRSTQESFVMRISGLAVSTFVLSLGCAYTAPPTQTANTAHPTLAEGESAPCGGAQVFFAAGAAELDDAARDRIDVYAGCLSRHETDVIYVAGSTDSAGTADDNVTLGRRRAFAVAERLHQQGVQVEFVIRSEGEQGATLAEPLWPLERSAEVTAVATP